MDWTMMMMTPILVSALSTHKIRGGNSREFPLAKGRIHRKNHQRTLAMATMAMMTLAKMKEIVSRLSVAVAVRVVGRVVDPQAAVMVMVEAVMMAAPTVPALPALGILHWARPQV